MDHRDSMRGGKFLERPGDRFTNEVSVCGGSLNNDPKRENCIWPDMLGKVTDDDRDLKRPWDTKNWTFCLGNECIELLGCRLKHSVDKAGIVDAGHNGDGFSCCQS